MAVGKEIRTKISSIKNTQKITSAMEMVAASKMRKAQNRMAVGKPYAARIREVIGHVANATPEYHHVYFSDRPVQSGGYIVEATARSIGGCLNDNTFKVVFDAMQEGRAQGPEQDFCVVGAGWAGCVIS